MARWRNGATERGPAPNTIITMLRGQVLCLSFWMTVMLDIQILGRDGSRVNDTRVLAQRHQYVAEYIQFKNMDRSQFASRNASCTAFSSFKAHRSLRSRGVCRCYATMSRARHSGCNGIWQLRDGRFSASGRGFSTDSGHAPSIWEQRVLLIFQRFW